MLARYAPALVSTLVLHYHLQLDAILSCIKHNTFTQTNEMNESGMRSSSRCTSSIKTRLGYCRTIQLRWLLTCLAMIAIQDETDEGCEQQSTADATPSDLDSACWSFFMLILVVRLRKGELRENITIKPIVFPPVTPPCCGTGLSLTFPDHQGESSGRQRGLLERQEGRICWRTRR